MARLLGLIANRPDLCTRFAEYEAEALSAHWRGPGRVDQPAPQGAAWGWGIGFFHAGEVLLKRRPLDERTRLDLGEIIADVRSDIIVAHVRRATVGALRTDNTHPFRYRQWVFAQTGTIASAGELRPRLVDSLPDFLQRSLRGDTDSELIFHLFLSFLHDAGKLDRPVVAVDDVFPALKSSLSLLDRIAGEGGKDSAPINVVLATPDYVVAANRGAPMAYRALAGREDFEPLFRRGGMGRMRLPDLEPCRLCAVASDFGEAGVPEGWTPLASGAMLALTRVDAPLVASPLVSTA
ncbi:MAG: class II glutamine amidotransferase [Myxococcota bacterium]